MARLIAIGSLTGAMHRLPQSCHNLMSKIAQILGVKGGDRVCFDPAFSIETIGFSQPFCGVLKR